jgi:hypothetical protein
MCLFSNELLPETQVETPFRLNPIADFVKKEIVQRQPPPPRPKPLILECFSGLTDPRLDRKKTASPRRYCDHRYLWCFEWC